MAHDNARGAGMDGREVPKKTKGMQGRAQEGHGGAGEAIGADVVRLVPPGLRERHRQGMERFLSTGQGAIIGRVVDVEGLRSDGSLVPVEMSLSAERGDGRWVFMAILRDDTARRRLG